MKNSSKPVIMRSRPRNFLGSSCPPRHGHVNVPPSDHYPRRQWTRLCRPTVVKTVAVVSLTVRLSVAACWRVPRNGVYPVEFSPARPVPPVSPSLFSLPSKKKKKKKKKNQMQWVYARLNLFHAHSQLSACSEMNFSPLPTLANCQLWTINKPTYLRSLFRCKMPL